MKLDQVWQEAAVAMGLKAGQKPAEPTKPPESKGGDPYADHAALLDRMRTVKKELGSQRWVFERGWFRNVLYYVGNQWITWDRSQRRWREKKIRRWVPKPVTNRFASTLNAVANALTANSTDVSFWPASDTAEDLATADVSDKVWPTLEVEMDVASAKKRLSRWVVLTGNGIVHPWWERSAEFGTTFIPYEQCPVDGQRYSPKDVTEAGGACPMHPEVPLIPATDELGQPVGDTLLNGRLRLDVLSPLELHVLSTGDDIKRQRRVIRTRAFDLSTVRRQWPQTATLAQPERQDGTSLGVQYMEALAYVTDESSHTSGRGADRGESVTVSELWELPSEQYPEGLYLAVAGDSAILEAGPLPYAHRTGDGRQEYFLPFVHFGYEPVPGRFWHKSPADDLVAKQDQRNRLESLIELCLMRSAYATWILPTGSSIANLTGEPGQVVRWSPTGTSGSAPKLEYGAGPPQGLFAWLEQLDRDFEELAGTFDVIKGSVPRGVSAGYAIQLLTERGYSRFASLFGEWENGWVDVARMALSIFQQHATDARLQMSKGDAGQWQLQRFLAADLSGAVDVKAESGGSKPRSKLAEQAIIEQLVKIGVIDPTQLEQRFAIAETFGMTHVLGGVDIDMRDAAREWDQFQTGAQLPMVRPLIDNHLIHGVDHRKRAKSDTFFSLPPELQMRWEQHILEHEMAMAPPMVGPDGEGGDPGLGPPPPGDEVSKAHEQGDPTMDTLRSGGAAAFGSPAGGM